MRYDTERERQEESRRVLMAGGVARGPEKQSTQRGQESRDARERELEEPERWDGLS